MTPHDRMAGALEIGSLLDGKEALALRRLDDRAESMIARTIGWAKINSGSANLTGLEDMATHLREAFSPLGEMEILAPSPAQLIDTRAGPSP